MIRALRATALGRQPFATSTLPPTHATTPLQRLAAQGWRSTTAKNTSAAPSRSIHSGFTARTTASPLLRGAWRRSTDSGYTKSSNVLGKTQKRNFGWSWSRQSSKAGAGGQAEESLSLSARLRKLSREYGWAAVGVYLGLSVLDFPFCFLLVKWAGTERIGMFLFTPKPRPAPPSNSILLGLRAVFFFFFFS